MHCGIALRESGSIDFYHNFRMVEAASNTIRKDADEGIFQDVTADFNSLYFKNDAQIYRCSMSWKQMIGFSVSSAIDLDHEHLGHSKALSKTWKKLTNN